MRVPVLGDAEVAMDIRLDHGLKLMEQLQVGEGLLHEYFLVVGARQKPQLAVPVSSSYRNLACLDAPQACTAITRLIESIP
ncbi:hypothetical protein OKHIF_40330 [Mycobacteroides chelonae]